MTLRARVFLALFFYLIFVAYFYFTLREETEPAATQSQRDMSTSGPPGGRAWSGAWGRSAPAGTGAEPQQGSGDRVPRSRHKESAHSPIREKSNQSPLSKGGRDTKSRGSGKASAQINPAGQRSRPPAIRQRSVPNCSQRQPRNGLRRDWRHPFKVQNPGGGVGNISRADVWWGGECNERTSKAIPAKRDAPNRPQYTKPAPHPM